MADFLARLKQRKLVQWALAYLAFAFALIQVIDVVAQQFGWPESIRRGITLALAVGFVVALVLAWYHGERGAQRVSGMELLIVALVLAVGGGMLWHFARPAASPAAVAGTARSYNSAACKSGPCPDNAAACRSGPCPRPAAEPQDPSVAAGASAAASASPMVAQAIPAKSVAVLPFENLSADKGNAYFADGMQDLILTKLADIGDLKVISRTSTLQYGAHPQNLTLVGQQLGAATILEGSVQKAGNQVLINVQLIDAKTDAHLWAQSYQRTLTNVFGVEGEVAAKVASALQAKISSQEATRLSTALSGDAGANDLFLRAEYQSNRGFVSQNTDFLKAAIPMYRQAVNADPKFALAYARLSWTESALALFGGGGMDTSQLRVDAHNDAQQALKLAPDLAAAHLAVAYSDYWGHDNFDAALKGFAATLALKPNESYALLGRGYIERRQGHFDAAIASLMQAFTLDPRNSAVVYGVGYAEATVGHYADAERWFRRAVALDPHNIPAKRFLVMNTVLGSGDMARAMTMTQGDDTGLKLTRVRLLHLQRQYLQALALLDSVPDFPGNIDDGLGPKALMQANLYRLLGENARSRPLFVQAQAQLQAQIDSLHGIGRATALQYIASCQLGLGDTATGFKSIARAASIAAAQADQVLAMRVMLQGAGLYAQARRADLAVPRLDQVLAYPGHGLYYSAVMLWLDPMWDPIRHDPAFQALLKQYAQYKPAMIPAAPAPASGGALR